jgi:hypothetical protein
MYMAMTYSPSMSPRKASQIKANASLITAAPELLAALKECRDIVTQNPGPWGDAIAEKLDTIARTAIAKATA